MQIFGYGWWLEITELSDRILETGEKILETVPIHDLVESIHSGTVTKDFVDMFVKLYHIDMHFRGLMRDTKTIFPLSDKAAASEDYHSFLALGLLEHDFNNMMTRMCYDEVLAKEPEHLKDRYVQEYEFSKGHLMIYENSRIGLGLIPYIVTGDRRFLFPVKTKYVADLLENLEEIHRPLYEVRYNHEFIPSDEYFCIHQLVKNAKMNINRAKEQSLINEDGNIIVKAANCYSYDYISVGDSGTGIEHEKFPKIFTTYTDTEHGTGIGLQVVKRLLELRKGRGSVISKVHCKGTYGYCINSGIIKQLHVSPRSNGTNFKLYFQK